ncbi:MAG: MBL fold metallo-hydrolase [Candidatus Omnitrophica bacterium]|nr:MBL fold metallo-hydrolase [Candidatus Omnitrophota bacterium]
MKTRNTNTLLKKFVVGPLETNSYIFGDEGSREVVLIDPGGESNKINKFIKAANLKLKYVINTHGHGDHIGGNSDFNVGVLVHKLDKDFLENPLLNLSASFGAQVISPKASRFLNDGDKIDIGNVYLEVIHTPGHTPGGICLRYDNLIFSGDTLFFEGVGRTDIPNASWEALMDSLKNKLMQLPDACKVYPGHGSETTIGHERKNNPFLV